LTGEAEVVSQTRAGDTGAELIGFESLAIAAPGPCTQGVPVAPAAIPSLSRPTQWLLALLLLAVAIVPLRRLAG
jgi:hypothetical protein